MTEESKKSCKYVRLTIAFLVGIICGIIIGALVSGNLPTYIEIQPSPLEDPLDFYVDVLEDMNYTVEERPLATNTYREVTFKELLWILQETGRTKCFVDYGEHKLFFERRMPKLWLQVDGIYYEVRFEWGDPQ